MVDFITQAMTVFGLLLHQGVIYFGQGEGDGQIIRKKGVVLPTDDAHPNFSKKMGLVLKTDVVGK